MNKKFLKTVGLTFFIAIFLFATTPLGALAAIEVVEKQVSGAQTSSTTNTGNSLNTTADSTNKSDKTYSGAGSAVGSAVGTCSVGQILANLVGSTIATGIKAITNSATSLVTDTLSGIISLKVPVADSTTNKNTAKLTTVVAGGGDAGGLAQNFLNSIGDVSLNGIAFCIANEMIKYIGESTITWIKSGFKGNPVFVDNPEKFFTNIAEQEASTFIQQVVGKTTGIDVCQPFKVQLAVDSIATQTSSSKTSLNCSLSTIKSNYQGFVSGNFSSGGIPGWFELIEQQNNYWGAKEIARSELSSKVSKKTNTATISLNWSKGYKNFTICTTTKNADGSCKKNADGTPGEKTTTLGGYIEHTVNARATSPQNRLEIAQTFDGVVSALVNELIKIAVNKAFDTDSTDDTEEISAYCSVFPAYPKVGEPVTWSAVAYGGDGDYSYSWSGDVSGSGASVPTMYSTSGSKEVVVNITSGSQTNYTSCYVTVYPATTTSSSAATNNNTTTQTSTSSISSISPTSGPKETTVTIYGSNFTSDSTVNFVGQGISLRSAPTAFSSEAMTFTVPSNYTTGCSNGTNCTGTGQVQNGNYQISVQTGDKTSNTKDFEVRN